MGAADREGAGVTADFSRLSDAALADWHRVSNDLWHAIERELAKRRVALREAQDKATRGWPEYRNAEELDQRDAEVGDASRDAFK
jgi:hypothetical protein